MSTAAWVASCTTLITGAVAGVALAYARRQRRRAEEAHARLQEFIAYHDRRRYRRPPTPH